MPKMRVYRALGDRQVVYGAGARIFQTAAHFGASEYKGRRNEYFKGKILFLCPKHIFSY
jgi:hypothetical protein